MVKLGLNPCLLFWMWFGHSLGCEFNWLNHLLHTAVVTRKQQLISNPPVTRGCLLTKRLITLQPPRYSWGKQVEGARRTAFIYRAGTFLCMRGVLCDLTTQIEHISLVVGVLGSLLICLLSFSSKAHNISSAMFYRIRVRYLHNTTESFTRIIGRTDLQYLGVIQRQRDTWLDINI